MALELCRVPNDADQYFEIEHELLDGPDGLLIENYASGGREIIGIEDQGPIGGRVGFFLPEGIFEDIEVSELPVELEWEDFPPPFGLIIVEAGQIKDIDFVDIDGWQGTLRVRQVGDAAITPHLLIPEGLYFPDKAYVPFYKF